MARRAPGAFERPGDRSRLTVLYDIDLDGRTDYRGALIFTGGGLRLHVAGRQRAFEPIAARRPNRSVVTFTQPVGVLFATAGEGAGEQARELQIAVTTSAGGKADRAPDDEWVPVPSPR